MISFPIATVTIKVFFKYISKIRVEGDTDRNAEIQQSGLHMWHL